MADGEEDNIAELTRFRKYSQNTWNMKFNQTTKSTGLSKYILLMKTGL
jgi:hypothetical protein